MTLSTLIKREKHKSLLGEKTNAAFRYGDTHSRDIGDEYPRY